MKTGIRGRNVRGGGAPRAPQRERSADAHTILLVDHSRNIRDFCKRELEREGCRVILAEDGRKALTIVKQTPPDVLVIDVETSDAEALKAVEWVLIHFADLPVIVHTGDRCRLDELRNLPVEACVEKSHDLTALKEAIARALAQREMNGPGHAAGGGGALDGVGKE